MLIADIRFLFGYDRWATAMVLDAAVGVDDETWSSPNVVGERGLGGILVHALGAHQRWRHSLSGSAEMPAPERGPLLTTAGHSPGDLDLLDYAETLVGRAPCPT